MGEGMKGARRHQPNGAGWREAAPAMYVEVVDGRAWPRPRPAGDPVAGARRFQTEIRSTMLRVTRRRRRS